MRGRHLITLISILALMLITVGVSAESPYIFGTFFWAEGVNIDAFSGKPGWVVNEVDSRDFRFQGWHHQYKQAVDEGHTWILRFNYMSGAPGVPMNPAEYARYASQCAHWAERVKDYVHIYVVGNEMHLSDITDAAYAEVFLMTREAIHAVQPEAIVVPGVVPGNRLRSISLIAGDYIGGFTDFHPGNTLLQQIDSWTDIPGVRTKPFYVTEQGATHPMPDNRARQHFAGYNSWNANNDHNIETGCWFVYYGIGNETFSMKMVPMTSADFEEAATNQYFNSYAQPYLYLTNINATSTDEVTATISWTTDAPATSSVEYWKDGDRTRLITQWNSYAETPKTNHSVQLPSLEAGATYHYQIRTFAVGRPWTRSSVQTFVQEGPGTGAIKGRVLAGGAPVHNAMVARWYEHSTNNELSVRTGQDGRFEMRAVPVGIHHIRVSASGASQNMLSSVEVRSGETNDLGDISLNALQNIVTNPGFETGNVSGWTTYGDALEVHQGPWLGGIQAHTGTRFAARATNHGTVNGGAYQRISATAGQQYVARIFSNIYRADSPYSDTISRVGLDPNGGTNPSSSSIRWTEYDMAYQVDHQEWRELITPVVTCSSGGHVTIFLEFRQFEDWGWHINCFDDAGVFVSQSLSTVPEPSPITQPVDSVADAKAAADGTTVSLTGVVATTRRSADFADRFWISDTDRASGIMVYAGTSGGSIPEGGRLSVTGTLTTLETGERALIDFSLQSGSSGSPLPALFMLNKEVGGADHLYDPGPPARGQRGVNGTGVNNVGLLIRVSGEVKSLGTGYVMISDGSGTPLKVTTSKLSTQPTVGQYMVATGICRVEPSGANLVPYVELRLAADAILY